MRARCKILQEQIFTLLVKLQDIYKTTKTRDRKASTALQKD